MAAEVDWTSLPGDLLTSIGELLAVPSRICFRAVCRTWRRSVEEEEAGAMPAPWIVVPNLYNGYCSRSFTLISAPTRRSFQWTLDGEPATCVGSNGGWLAMSSVIGGEHVEVSLVNPLTGVRVELPRVMTAVWVEDDNVEVLLYTFVWKVAFAPNPSAQDHDVAILCNDGQVMCTTSAIDGWRRLRGAESGELHSLDLAYHGGKFYCAMAGSMVTDIDVTSIGADAGADVVQPCTARSCLRFIDLFREAFIFQWYHLVFSGDGAMHMVWMSLGKYSLRRYRRLFIMRYDAGSSSWRPATTLGGWAFLVGDGDAQCISADAHWPREDTVYFASGPLSYQYRAVQGRPGIWDHHGGARRQIRVAVDDHGDYYDSSDEDDDIGPMPFHLFDRSIWFTPSMK